MKFVLVEPIITEFLTLVPNLGCASLMGHCKYSGVSSSLITGQVRLIRDLFQFDSMELFDIINNSSVSKDQTFNYFLEEYKGYKRDDWESEFGLLYNDLYQLKSINNFLNRRKLLSPFLFYRNAFNFYNDLIKQNILTNFNFIQRYINQINSINPDIVGFSLHQLPDEITRTIINLTKNELKIPIIAGGWQTAYWSEDHINDLFSSIQIDALVTGYGEKTLIDVIENLPSKSNLYKIPNVVFRDGSKIKFNNIEFREDLNELSYPDYSQSNLDLFLVPERVLPIQTSRGCSWNRCSFCSHQKAANNSFNQMSHYRVLDLMESMFNHYQTRNFSFVDAEISARRLELISDEIIHKGRTGFFNYSCYCRFESGFLKDNLFKRAQTSGLTSIFWGLESANDRIRRLMKKGTSIESCKKILKLSSHEGIKNYCFIFFGFPTETESEAIETEKFLFRNAHVIDHVMSGYFILAKSSEIGKNPAKRGISTSNYETYSIKDGLSQDEAKQFHLKFLKKLSIDNLGLRKDGICALEREHFDRELGFLIDKHQPIDKNSYQVLKNISITSDFLNKFPVISGDKLIVENEVIYHPINFFRSAFSRHLKPAEPIPVSKEHVFLIDNSDGTRSIAEIIEGCKMFIGKSEVERFFRSWTEKGYVILFF